MPGKLQDVTNVLQICRVFSFLPSCLSVYSLYMFIFYTHTHIRISFIHSSLSLSSSILFCIVFTFNKSKNNSSVAPEESQDDICTSRWQCWRTCWWKRREIEEASEEWRGQGQVLLLLLHFALRHIFHKTLILMTVSSVCWLWFDSILSILFSMLPLHLQRSFILQIHISIFNVYFRFPSDQFNRFNSTSIKFFLSWQFGNLLCTISIFTRGMHFTCA